MRNADPDERDLVGRLVARDAGAFAKLYRRHNAAMVRIAAGIVASRAVAEEVAQEAWLAVMTQIGGFEGRSSLAGWIFAILVNGARSRARREGRLVSFDDGGEEDGLAAAFDGRGRWKDMPDLWDEVTPERIVAGRRLMDHVRDAIETLPAAQRAVLVLRTQQGLEPAEICAALGISEGNMRVLLHRARMTLRARLAGLL